jgi:hypothetical protein
MKTSMIVLSAGQPSGASRPLSLSILRSVTCGGRGKLYAGSLSDFATSTNTGTAVVPPVSRPIDFGSS